jgi:hypothetical protein
VAFNRQYPFVDVLLADIIEKRRGARHARQSAEGLSGLTYHAGKHVRLEEHAFAPQPITGEAFVRVEARTASSQFRSAKYDTNIVNAAIIQQWQP